MKTLHSLILTLATVFAAQAVVAQISLEESKKMRTDFANNAFPGDSLGFSAAYVDGTTVSSDMLKGTNVFYVFGGVTCGPCITLGRVMTLLTREKKYDGQDVKLVFMTDDDAKGQQTLIDRFGFDPDIMVSMPSEKARDIGVLGTVRPLILFVDRSGKIVFKSTGFVHTDDMAVASWQFELQFGSEIDALLETQTKQKAWRLRFGDDKIKY